MNCFLILLPSPGFDFGGDDGGPSGRSRLLTALPLVCAALGMAFVYFAGLPALLMLIALYGLLWAVLTLCQLLASR